MVVVTVTVLVLVAVAVVVLVKVLGLTVKKGLMAKNAASWLSTARLGASQSTCHAQLSVLLGRERQWLHHFHPTCVRQS